MSSSSGSSNASSTATTTAEQNATYLCSSELPSSFDPYQCATNCVGLEACTACNCVIQPALGDDGEGHAGGAWGPVMDVILCLLPIIFLVTVTLLPKPLKTTVSLPSAAAIMWAVRLMYLNSDVVLTFGCVVAGLHEALTPLSIVAGAIFLFETMEATMCLPYMMREMKHLTGGHPVAEVMLIFPFVYMLERAAGFGTPAALAAPMLISLGHKDLETVVTLLVLNTLPAVWGACGTPLWFGFGNLNLPRNDLLLISQKGAVALAFGAVIVGPWALTVLLPRRMVKSNLLFVLSSLLVTVGPSVGIAMVSYEFPALLGGIIGMGLTATLIKWNVGLKQLGDNDEQELGRSVKDISTVSTTSGIVVTYRESIRRSAVRPLEESNGEEQPPAEVSETFKPSVTGDMTATEHDVEASASSVPDKFGNRIVSLLKGDMSNDEGEIHTVDESTAEPSPLLAAAAANEDGDNTSQLRKNSTSITAHGKSLQEVVDHELGDRKTWSEGYLKESLMRTFPIWGVVLLLILTRVSQIGLKPLLLKQEPYFEIDLGSYGLFRLSVSVVFMLKNILTYPGLNWDYPLFYTPFILPFIVVSLITFVIFRKGCNSTPLDVSRVVLRRLASPAIALAGALVLVQLTIQGGNGSPAYLIGSNFADWFQQGFVVISPLLGALGSFFAGSTTISNLTFGGVQEVAAERVGTSVTAMLALQAVGGAAGNGVALNNIIAVCAVVGLNVGEGRIVGITYKYVFSLTTIATVVMLAFFIRF
jgi:L-lactate permease